ncbi:MAG TPA: ankyrin repeat domain-containing protein [Vicinamibacterales bacterium]|nr:ankyrin repeat domain-containing protein [Vicinamibacterales bacterium]
MTRSWMPFLAAGALLVAAFGGGLHAAGTAPALGLGSEPGAQGSVERSRTAVADAAMRRDVPAVRALVRAGADVNGAQGDGMTALHWAATHGDTDLTHVLLYAGANVKATSRLGRYTPLHLASESGFGPVVTALLGRGADANAATTTGATPLMLAAQSGNVATVAALLDATADVNAAETANGQTPLMFAAAYDRADVVTLLLNRGAAAATTSKVVDLAALTMDGPMEPQGAPQNPPRTGAGAIATGGGRAPEPGAAPASPAAAPARPAAAARPADVAGATRPFRYNELIGAQGGLSALHFAARQGAAAAARALIAHGADVNLRSPGDATTPLLIATLNGHFDLARYMLDHGADPNLVSRAGAGALYATLNVQWAPKAAYPQPRSYLQQRTTYLDLMRALLDQGADPNARLTRKVWYSGYNFDQSGVDEVGATPFWRAAYASDVEAMRLLVARGADPNIPSARPAERRRGLDGVGERRDTSDLAAVPVGGPGIPALQAVAGVGYGKGFAGNSHVFAPAGMMPAVKYLVEELGVDVNAVDYEGNTVIHHAAARGDTAMIKYLVAKGADVTLVNRAGQTTIDLANGPVQRVQPFPETMDYLASLGAKNNHKCVSC